MTELTYRHKKSLGETRHMLDVHTFSDDIVPPEVTEVIQAFAAELSPLPPVHVPSRDDGHAAYGWPADGIGEKIRIDGGSIQFGWRIREWPGVLLTAEFHAVWVDPGGALVDITPDVTAGDRSLFVPVSSDTEPAGSGQRPPTRYRVLHVTADQSDAVAERIARMKSGQRAYEDRRAQRAGRTLEQWILDKYYVDPLPGQITAFVDACNRYDARLPTLPSLIQTETEEEQLYGSSDAQGEAAAGPDVVGTVAGDDTSGAHEEQAPATHEPAVGIEPGHAADAAAGTPVEAAEDETDDYDEIDDVEGMLDYTWHAVDELERWSRERAICREVILRTMSGD